MELDREAIEILNRRICSCLGKLADEDIEYLISQMYDPSWVFHLEDDDFVHLVAGMMILGLSTYLLVRRS